MILLGALTTSAPSGAIETETFGLDVAVRTEDARLHVPLAAGETSSVEILVWNKQDAPLELRLTVSPVAVDGNGKASLGGDDLESVGWVDVPETVDLAPAERRTVRVEVRAPRKLEARVRTVAIVAEPITGGAQLAVVQRLALTTYLEPDEGSLIASLGPFPWIALAILVGVVGLALRATLRRRNDGSAPTRK